MQGGIMMKERTGSRALEIVRSILLAFAAWLFVPALTYWLTLKSMGLSDNIDGPQMLFFLFGYFSLISSPLSILVGLGLWYWVARARDEKTWLSRRRLQPLLTLLITAIGTLLVIFGGGAVAEWQRNNARPRIGLAGDRMARRDSWVTLNYVHPELVQKARGRGHV
jgi:hypothetical protein